MSSLASCIRKAGKALPLDDARMLEKSQAEYQANGMPHGRATERAVLDLYAQEQDGLGAIAAQVEAAGGEVPAWVAQAMEPVLPAVDALVTPDGAAPAPEAPSIDAAPADTDAEASKPAAEAPSPNTIFTEDAAAAARDLIRRKLGGGTLNVGLDPEVVQAGITLAGYHIEKGARTFAAYSRAMLNDLGDMVRPYLKQWYAAAYFDPLLTNLQAEMTPPGELAAAEVSNVSGSESDLAGDRPANAVGPVEGTGGIAGGGARSEAGGAAGQSSGEQAGRARVRGRRSAADREQGNLALDSGERPTASLDLAGIDDGGRGDAVVGSGIQADRDGSKPTAPAVASRSVKGPDKLAAQRAAEATPVTFGDAANIDATLPYLLDGQREDVGKAETRFAKPDGYGMLFTNGTGTGKTFTGLGVVKRMARSGKTNILIAVPNDKIAYDWMQAGLLFGLSINQLSTTRTAGGGVVITTYANLRMNDDLARRKWHLVVADEAHYLSAGKEFADTATIDAVRAITLHPRGIYERAKRLHREKFALIEAISDEAKKAKNAGDSAERMQNISDRLERALATWKVAFEKVEEDVEARQGAERPRLLALSATPFAYELSVDWADGYLFEYSGGIGGSGYNEAIGRNLFFMQHFGYRMRYNKLTEPDAKVDRGVMQRQFNTWLKKNGVLSGRVLDVAADYDRRFVLVESGIGSRIDEALEWLRVRRNEAPADKRVGWTALSERIDDQFDYLSRTYLLEAIKASAVVTHVREHLALGRKVLVYHDFKKGGGFNPFSISPLAYGMPTDDPLPDNTVDAFNAAIEMFEEEFSDLVNSNLGDMPSPLDVFGREFPDVLLFNGNVTPRHRLANVARFNDDASGPQVMLLQSAAGKEGISLHDTTGKHQRVLFNLGLPVAPTTAIQTEGRIYRIGQVTNAIMRYLNTGTDWERFAFASKIAQRASTAENLAAGEMARSLKQSFIDSFEASSTDFNAGHSGEGYGGKAADKAANALLTEFDRAKAFYFGQQKRTSRTKSAEGIDYFPTPEPLALKMVEWAGVRPGDKVLEPSAGHGSIARWFPETAETTAVEPSSELRSRLALVFGGKIVADLFENLHSVNKYDAIVMNPPFGRGGSMAIPHLAKATGHLRDGGRVVALIPSGPTADRAFDKWFESDDAKDFHLVADVKLPSVTFERAGTGVMARLVVIDKGNAHGQVSRDYSNAQSIGEFFDHIEDGSIPDRIEPVKAADAAAESSAGVVSTGGISFRMEQVTHAKKGTQLYVAAMNGRVDRDVYDVLVRKAKIHGGYYSSFKGSGAIPGFQFPSADARAAFIDQAGGASPDGTIEVREDSAQYSQGEILNSSGTVESPSGPKRPVGDVQPAAAVPEQPSLFFPAHSATATTTTLADRASARGIVNQRSRVKSLRVGVFRTAFDVIDTWEKAAHVLAPLRKSAFEQVLVLAVDKDSKPLFVLHVGQGSVNSALVHPREIVLPLAERKDVAGVWLAHNHPSAGMDPSDADVAITRRISEVLDDVGAKVIGHIIFGGGKTANLFWHENILTTRNVGEIAAGRRDKVIPRTQRVFVGRKPKGGEVIEIRGAEDVGKLEQANGHGLHLLDIKHNLVGTLPLTGDEFVTLGQVGGKSSALMREVMEAVATTNAAAVIFTTGKMDDAKTGPVIRYLQEKLAMIDVRMLDAVFDGQSMAQRGVIQERGFYSIGHAVPSKGSAPSVIEVRKLAATAEREYGVTINVVPNISHESMPERVRGLRPEAAGYTNGYEAWVFTDNLTSLAHAQTVIAHEVIGHVGVERLVGEAEWSPIVDTVQGVLDGSIGVGTQAQTGAANRAASLSARVQRPEFVSAEVGEAIHDAKRLNPGANDTVLAKEAVAIMAERGIKASMLDRLLAAMRRGLRKLFGRLGWTDAELRDLLARSREGLRAGREAASAERHDVVKPEPLYSLLPPTADNERNADAALRADPRTQQGVAEILEAANERTLTQRIGDFIDTTRPGWMKGLSRTHIVEIGKDLVKEAVPFDKIARAMEAYSNSMMEPAAEQAMAWADLIGDDQQASAAMAGVMHDATIEQFDPDIQTPRSSGGRPFPGSVIQQSLKDRFDVLPDAAKGIYRKVREIYKKRRQLHMAALIDRIEAAAMDGRKKAELVAKVRAFFESPFLKGPYFPLGRFGNYWLNVVRGAETPEFLMFEIASKWRDAESKLAAAGYTIIGKGKKIQELRADGAPGAGFMTDIIDIIDEAATDDLAPMIDKQAADALKDAAWQLYLEALPELSMRKSSLHRKGTPGYSRDAMRVFSNHMTHGAKQIARLRYGHHLATLLRSMRDSAPKSSDPAKYADVTEALDSAFQWMMKPTSGSLATRLTSLGFVFYLGMTPAAAMVNMFQNVTIAYPILGARFGFDKAGVALLKASADYIKSTVPGEGAKAARAVLESEMGGDMGEALKYLEESGIIDRTQTMALTGLGEDRAALSIKEQQVMRLVGALFHHAERYNRESTAIAAYRLSRESGMDHDAAVDKAYEMVVSAHYDYCSANRAPILRSDTARVLFLFKQYAQNTIFLLWRGVYQSTVGESPEVRRLARRELAGILGMTTLIGGVTALPLYTMVMGIINLVAGMFGDDDDPPFDAEFEFRVWLAQKLGKTGGELVARGSVNTFVGADLSSRISLDELLIRSSDRPLEGRDLALHYLEQAAGPVVGIGIKATQGAAQMAEGDVLRGAENMIPKATRDLLKAERFGREGALNLSGQPIVEDVSWWEMALQSSGYTPSRISAAYERANAAKRIEDATLKRRSAILSLHYRASIETDQAAQILLYAEAAGSVTGWNTKNPDWPITFKQIRASMKGRATAAQRNQDGVYLNPTVARRLEGQEY